MTAEQQRLPVSENYLRIKRSEIVEQVMVSSLVLEHSLSHEDSLPKEMIDKHKMAIIKELESARSFGFKPSDICREVNGLLHPPQEKG